MHVLMKGSGRMTAGRAVKTIRRLSEGGEIALTGSFRGTSTAVPLLDEEEATSWLSRLDGNALYLHDDVSFEASAIERLAEALDGSGSMIAAAAESGSSGELGVPILMGPTQKLAGYLAGSGREGEIEHVADVRVVHEGTCTSTSRPLLVASMIVRDEADNIGECLSSLDGLVDRIEIVDTGSLDDTIAIARAHGAIVTSADWTDDFGAARNIALERSRDARFILHVDADERVVVDDPESFRRALASTHLRAILVPMRNLSDGRVTSEFEAVRVFSTEDTRWIGRVHEYAADADGTPLAAGFLSGLRIDHFGYHPEVVAEKDKWNRNVALAEAAYAADPSFKTRLDLARSLAWRSDDERAFQLFEEAASDLTGASNGAAAFVVAHVALSHQIQGDFDSAHDLARQALDYCTGEFVAHLAQARAWRAVGDDAAIVAAHFDRSASGLEQPMFDTVATRSMTDNLVAGALARSGRHADAVELAASVLDHDPKLFDEWKSLASMPEQMRTTALPLLVSMDTTGRFVEGLMGEIPLAELSALVLAHVESREPTPHTVITGIMAAVLSEDEVTASDIAAQGVCVLDAEQRAATAERCRLRGATTVASLLDPLPVQPTSPWG